MMYQPGRSLADYEKQIILEAFEFHQHNKTRTACALGIAIRTLDSKLDIYSGKKQTAKEKANVGLQVEPSKADCA